MSEGSGRYTRSRQIHVSEETMTRPDWQKKKKKMAGREGPKKGKNR
jgi:hypothetical protein